MKSSLSVLLTFLLIQNYVMAQDDVAIRVLLNKGIEADKLQHHCSAPERLFLEQAVNVGAEDSMMRRSRTLRRGIDCAWYCKNIVPGYCYMRTPLCRGYRRNLISSDSSTGDDFLDSIPIMFTHLGGFFGFGSPDDMGGDAVDGGSNAVDHTVSVPEWVQESNLMGALDGVDFSGIIGDFGLEKGGKLAVPAELSTTVGGSCDVEIATTEALLFKLLEEDLSMQCLALLKQEVTFECISLD